MTREEARKIAQGLITDFKCDSDTMVDFCNTVIKALDQTSWIPVSERLPENHDCYLVTIKWKGSYSGDVYIETNMAVYREKPQEWDCDGVIAWMPLPESYKESEE